MTTVLESLLVWAVGALALVLLWIVASGNLARVQRMNGRRAVTRTGRPDDPLVSSAVPRSRR